MALTCAKIKIFCTRFFEHVQKTWTMCTLLKAAKTGFSNRKTLEKLPPDIPLAEIETRSVLKKLSTTRSALAELKGTSATIPNEHILIDTLSLQEAKDSSGIENIVTTHDELYRSNFRAQSFSSPEAKEVHSYAEALKKGFYEVREKEVITKNTILRIQETIEGNDAGIRTHPGTKLTNDRTGKVVYEPPQDYDTIVGLLDNLVWFIHEKDAYDVDPLVKMAMIHHQFESIHPFYDGNGRTGRILNILYLVLYDLLTLPVLYISRYIIRNRQTYYQYLQHIRETNNWKNWILYMLDAVEITAYETIQKIHAINSLMSRYKHRIRTELPNIYSQDLINNLFRHPYTRIAWLQAELGVVRRTARSYLEKLTEAGILIKIKMGRNNYYINDPLFNLLIEDEAEAGNPKRTSENAKA